MPQQISGVNARVLSVDDFRAIPWAFRNDGPYLQCMRLDFLDTLFAFWRARRRSIREKEADDDFSVRHRDVHDYDCRHNGSISQCGLRRCSLRLHFSSSAISSVLDSSS